MIAITLLLLYIVCEILINFKKIEKIQYVLISMLIIFTLINYKFINIESWIINENTQHQYIVLVSLVLILLLKNLSKLQVSVFDYRIFFLALFVVTLNSIWPSVIFSSLLVLLDLNENGTEKNWTPQDKTSYIISILIFTPTYILFDHYGKILLLVSSGALVALYFSKLFQSSRFYWLSMIVYLSYLTDVINASVYILIFPFILYLIKSLNLESLIQKKFNNKITTIVKLRFQTRPQIVSTIDRARIRNKMQSITYNPSMTWLFNLKLEYLIWLVLPVVTILLFKLKGIL